MLVDAPTLEQAISDIQEVIAMGVDIAQEEEWALPSSVPELPDEPHRAVLPIIVGEYHFTKPKPRPVQAKHRKV